MRCLAIAAWGVVCWVGITSAGRADTFPVAIEVDCSQSLGTLPPMWRFFGADEPNYATMHDGRKLLGELGELAPRQVYFRTHNLLTSGDGTPALKWGSTGVYSEDAAGKPRYDWKILDQIFDAYRDAGVRPYVQIGFMPRDLSTKPDPYQHHWDPTQRYEEIFTGWAHPPKDYAKWGELVRAWAAHVRDRYGAEEVATWYWQTWNEANAGYWQGTPEEFFKLHDYAVDAVRREIPQARVGGPDTAGAGGEFTYGFLDHCFEGVNGATGQRGTPLDFVSFHAKGAPQQTGGHVRMGIATQLQEVERGFRIVASHPRARKLPIVIGECDPEGCAACQGPQLAYRNGTMYSSYTAASYARIWDLARKYDVNLEGALTWAFEFEGQPLFAGFRDLATGGIDKPVLGVFRMFSQLGGARVAATSDHALPLEAIVRNGVRQATDVGALATVDKDRVAVLVWHYHDDDVPGDDAAVTLSLAGVSDLLGAGTLRATVARVDATHANAYAAWKTMGSPAELTATQRQQLETASRLVQEPGELTTADDAVQATFTLPRQGVALVVIERDQ